MRILSTILIFVAIFSVASSYDCPGKANEHKLVESKPKLQKSVPNGKRYIIHDGIEPLMHLHVAVLNGTAYEMGYAMGKMFKEEIHSFMEDMEVFFIDGSFAWVQDIAAWQHDWANLTNKEKIEMGLNMEVIATKHYSPQRFFDEIKGISDAAGVDYNKLLRYNLFPELTRAICSIVGIWGNASADGNVFQLRALDYLAEAPFNNKAVAIVYNPTEEGSQHFINFGWPGMIGTLAAYNGKVGIGERVWDNDDDSHSSIFGQPWMWVLRDAMQFGTKLEDTVNFLYNANRTYDIRIGVGSREDNSFRAMQYRYKDVTLFTDKNFSKPFGKEHPQMDGVFFWYKNGHDQCFSEILSANYGKLTPETIYRQLAPIGKTGDTIMAVYSYMTDEVYIAMAQNFKPAYNNPVFRLNMTEWWAVRTDDGEEVEEPLENESDAGFLGDIIDI